jgi:hypothetical protein
VELEQAQLDEGLCELGPEARVVVAAGLGGQAEELAEELGMDDELAGARATLVRQG